MRADGQVVKARRTRAQVLRQVLMASALLAGCDASVAGSDVGDTASKGPIYFDVPDVCTTLSSPDDALLHVKLQVSVALEGVSAVEALNVGLPMVVDGFVLALRDRTAGDLRGREATARLADELLAIVRSTVPAAPATRVLFKSIDVRSEPCGLEWARR